MTERKPPVSRISWVDPEPGKILPVLNQGILVEVTKGLWRAAKSAGHVDAIALVVEGRDFDPKMRSGTMPGVSTFSQASQVGAVAGCTSLLEGMIRSHEGKVDMRVLQGYALLRRFVVANLGGAK